MAAKAFDLEELETVCRVVVAGHRSDRLEAMNAFRVGNSKTAVDYLVNAETISRDAYDTAVTAFTADVSNAVGTSVTADTDELEDIFTYLLVTHRNDRLDVLNVIRTELTLDPVTYLVNMHIPNSGDRDTAFTNVTADAAA